MMSLLVMSDSNTCLYCGHTPLVQNDEQKDWRHCPVCDPKWVEAIQQRQRFALFLAAGTLARDPRGRPNKRPS